MSKIYAVHNVSYILSFDHNFYPPDVVIGKWWKWCCLSIYMLLTSYYELFICFSDFPWSVHFKVPTSTYKQNFRSIGPSVLELEHSQIYRLTDSQTRIAKSLSNTKASLTNINYIGSNIMATCFVILFLLHWFTGMHIWWNEWYADYFWKDFNWNDNRSIWCEKMCKDKDYKDQQNELYDLTIRENI